MKYAITFIVVILGLMVLIAATENGKTILSGPTSVIGNTSITGTLGVSGAVTASTTLAVTGDISSVGGGMQHQISYWYQDNVAAEQSAVALNMDGNASRAEVPTIRAGSIMGIAIYSNEARADGTLTADATIDGSVTGLQAVLNGSATQTKVTTQAKDADTFTAGQRLGVKITTDSGWLPVTADITVTLLIEQ